MSTSNTVCKDGASKSNDDDVCEMNDMLHNMSTADNEESISVCANCGKEGTDVNNTCNKCKMVKYCNAACKKKHRHKHKKDCEEYCRLAAEKHDKELRIAAELHDEKLFKQPPPKEDCPLCFVRLPTLGTGIKYKPCCGKVICSGCSYAPVYDNQGNKVAKRTCPFCRTPPPTDNKEIIERLQKRVEVNDSIAILNQGNYYRDGTNGYPQDYTKALELWHRAAELGYTGAYCRIAYAYSNGEGVDVDKMKAKHHYELAAMGGDEVARSNLGINEAQAGNLDRAIKHWMIAVSIGDAPSLDRIKQLYTNGYATKDDYTKALQFYQAYLGEIKSAQRDKAAAAREDYRYY